MRQEETSVTDSLETHKHTSFQCCAAARLVKKDKYTERTAKAENGGEQNHIFPSDIIVRKSELFHEELFIFYTWYKILVFEWHGNENHLNQIANLC